MKQLLIVAIIATSSSLTYGQSDLNRIINGIQKLQQQRRPPQQSKPSPGNNTRMAPAQRADPNASGNSNRGQFDGSHFFGRGQSNGNVVYPGQNQQYLNQQGQGNSRPYNGQNYPSGTVYINGRPYQQGQPYPSQGQTVYNGSIRNPAYSGSSQPYQNQTVTRITYPDPPMAPAKVYSQLPIVVRCADGTVGTCSYELLTAGGSAYPYTITGGRTQKLTESTSWTLRYKPTSTAAAQSYRLRGGKTYEIHKNGNAWQLFMMP